MTAWGPAEWDAFHEGVRKRLPQDGTVDPDLQAEVQIRGRIYDRASMREIIMLAQSLGVSERLVQGWISEQRGKTLEQAQALWKASLEQFVFEAREAGGHAAPEPLIIPEGQIGAAVVPVPVEAPACDAIHPQRGAPVWSDRYTDGTGRTYAVVATYGKAGPSQYWTWRRFANGAAGWQPRPMDGERPLFRLVHRPASPSFVLICTSERSAAAAAGNFPGAWVTAVMGGPRGVARTDMNPIKGLPVLIWGSERDDLAPWYEAIPDALPVDPEWIAETIQARPHRDEGAEVLSRVLGPRAELGRPRAGTRSAPAARGGGAAAGSGRTLKRDGSDWAELHMMSGGRGAPTGEAHAALINRISHWLDHNGIVPDGMYGFTKRGVVVTMSDAELVRDLYIELQHEGGLTRTHVGTILEFVVAQRRAARRREIVERITAAGDTAGGLEQLAILVQVLTGMSPDSDDFDLHLTAVAHSLWQIKRLMAGMDSADEMMLVLTGAQGAGKSTVLRMLLAPLEEFSINVSHTSLSDDRYQASLGVAFAAVWDELAGSSKAEMAKVKHSITAKCFDPRQFFSHNLMKVRRTITFFGASNDALSDVLPDFTGMRRFWEIVSPRKYDWDLLATVDMPLLWQAVDHRDASPLKAGDIHARIKAVQDSYRPYDPIVAWIDEECADGWPERKLRIQSAPEAETLETIDWKHGHQVRWWLARLNLWLDRSSGASLPAGVVALRKRLKQEGCLIKRHGPNNNRGPEFIVPPEKWRPNKSPVPPPTVTATGGLVPALTDADSQAEF